MNVPEGQRLILAWLDDPGELQQLLKVNPSVRRIYLIEPGGKRFVSNHPVVRSILLSERHKLPTWFAKDQRYFSEARVSLYFGRNILTEQYDICSELQAMLLQFTQQHLSSIALRATRGWHILANELCNLQHVQYSADQLFNSWNNDPVVIVGAGPSLDDTVSLLKQFRNRIRIITCDGAWNTLAQNGIIPDLVVTTDDTHKVWRYFDVQEEQVHVPVLAMLQSCCHIVRHHHGPVFFARNGRERDQLLADKFGLSIPVLDAGLCVGHAALALANKMSTGQMILTGFDLGFKNGKFHPEHQPLPYYHHEPPPEANLTRAEANDGGTIQTELSMQFYRRGFEQRIAGYTSSVINATAGGARIHGTRYQTLEETLAPLKKLAKSPLRTKPFPNTGIQHELAVIAQNAQAVKNPRVTLLDAMKNRPDHWVLTFEAINPALITGVELLLEDRDNQIEGAEIELDNLLPQLYEIFSQQLSIVSTLCKIAWPRPKTGRAFAFCSRSVAEQIAAQERLALISHEIDPDNLPGLWDAIETEKIDTVIVENATLLPAAWSLPGLRCINVRSDPNAPEPITECRVPGYELLF